jgi:hypothetical protein
VELQRLREAVPRPAEGCDRARRAPCGSARTTRRCSASRPPPRSATCSPASMATRCRGPRPRRGSSRASSSGPASPPPAAPSPGRRRWPGAPWGACGGSILRCA